jgi:uncharacterized delta-60 repeat protein
MHGWRQLCGMIQTGGRILFAVVASAVVMASLALSAGALAAGDVGELDPQFNAAGEQPGVIEGLPPGEALNWAVTIQPDGKIVVAAAVYATLPESRFGTETIVVTRLNADGTLDETFNAGGPSPGMTEISFGAGTTSGPDVIHVDSDGRIVVLGSGDDAAHNFCWAVARLNSDGTLDASFNPSGSVPGTEMLNNGNEGALTNVGEGAVTAEGKILLGGANGGHSVLERLNADGSVDTTFNPGGSSPGKAIVAAIGADAVAIQSEGTIDLAGGGTSGYGRMDRIAADGSGILWSAGLPFEGNQPLQVLPLANGAVDLVKGTLVARYTADGSLDASFGSNGYTTPMGGSGYGPAALAPDGSIVVATNATVTRFTPNGRLDAAFGTAFENYGVAVQADGKIIVVGSAPSGGSIARYLAGSTVAVVTEPASSVTQTSATLNATVNPEGGTVSDCHFDYGTSEAYGSSVGCASLPGSGTSPVAVSAALAGLTPSTTYHIRVVATNEGGTRYGADRKFTTLGPPDFGRCVKLTGEKVGTKTVYHGGYTASTCLVASGTHTGKYEWEPSVVKAHFTTALKEGVVTLETVKKVKVTCKAESGSGEYSGTKEVTNVVFKLTGCESGGEKCTTPSHAEGELETKSLEGELGWEVKELKKVALDLYPVSRTGTFIEYHCVGGVPITVTGAILVPVTVDKMLVSPGVKYKQTAGKQKPERFEGGLPEVLTASLNGEVFEQMGLAASLTQVNEEAVEINAVV